MELWAQCGATSLLIVDAALLSPYDDSHSGYAFYHVFYFPDRHLSQLPCFRCCCQLVLTAQKVAL
jgi:hypothetical protein